MSTDTDTTEKLPAAVVARLAENDRRVAILTPQVDRSIAQAARAQFGARRTQRPLSAAPLWGLSAAAAAALLFVVIAVRMPPLLDDPAREGPLPAALQRTVAAGDYDGSGTVDVLDAWRLSRELAQNPRFAANETVADLMQRIVALDGGAQ